jgi:hypothetical protein
MRAFPVANTIRTFPVNGNRTFPITDLIAAAGSSGAIIPSGDMQAGTDRLLVSGDMQSGSDAEAYVD